MVDASGLSMFSREAIRRAKTQGRAEGPVVLMALHSPRGRNLRTCWSGLCHGASCSLPYVAASYLLHSPHNPMASSEAKPYGGTAYFVQSWYLINIYRNRFHTARETHLVTDQKEWALRPRTVHQRKYSKVVGKMSSMFSHSNDSKQLATLLVLIS